MSNTTEGRTMRIMSRAYGPIEVSEAQVFDFPQGIFGFEEHVKFALFDAHQKPFYWLQSLVDPEIAFILIRPNIFRDEYEHGINLTDLEDLEAKSWEELLVFAIVTIPLDHGPMTANLQGPIFLNKRTRKGKQAISPKDEFRTKHNILEEMAQKSEKMDKGGQS